MKVTLEDAYTYLELPYGAGEEEIVSKYRKLAQIHHPGSTSGSEKKFIEVNCALQRLIGADQNDDIVMDMSTMKSLYDSMFGKYNPSDGADNGHDYYTSDSDYSDEEFLTDNGWTKNRGLTQEEIDQNAKELINEEEKEKRKAEKRKAKKKKRKEKKKLEKEQEQQKNQYSDRLDQPGRRSSDEEGLDPNAAFVKNSKKKRGDASSTHSSIKPESAERDKQTNGFAHKKSDTVSGGGDVEDVVIKSRQIAVRGNEMAQKADYPAAISLFSEAIKLDPSDFRFYGNRSYCYDRTMQFDRALADADIAIKYAPEWPKGYFRKGRALAGLKLFTDAEQAFIQVLKLDKNCEEALKELSRVRTHQLIDMGFSPKQAEQAIQKNNSVQSALDSLLASMAAEPTLGGHEMYTSDEETEVQQSIKSTSALHKKTQSTNANKVPHQPEYTPAAPVTMVAAKPRTKNTPLGHAEEKKMDPSNPEGLTALWVGNVLPTVKESDLQKLFNRYGNVSSVRCLPDKFCAFVNFKSKETAGKAMNALQHHEVGGQHLLIKFPDNPIQNGASDVTLKQAKPVAVQRPIGVKPPTIQPPTAAQLAQEKTRGPVGNNGDECYFWRTTGCSFAGKCRWKHLPENRGIDRKPWQRVK